MSTTLEASHDAADVAVRRAPYVEAPTGQLVVGTRQALKNRILDELHAGQRGFVLDFSQCGYIDTSGLGVLVSIAKKIRDADGRLVLCGMNDDLATLLELTKIATLFTVTGSREHAIQLAGPVD